MNGALLKQIETPSPSAAAAATAGRRLRHAMIVAVVVVLLAALAGLLPRWLRREALREQTRDLSLQTVSLVSPAPGKAAPSLIIPGEVRPLVEAPIYARASGYLKSYFVDIGAQVKEGETLAEIDTPELNQELAQARAQLDQAKAALALAQTTADRWADLIKSSSVSEQEAAEKQADLALKSATVEAAKANVLKLQDLQSFQTVKAPFAGTITARGTDLGQLIAAGSGRELFRLAQTKMLRVYVRVPQSLSRGVVPGQMAEMTVPELPGRVFPAKIVRTAGAMSTDSRTLLTELEVDNARGELFAGAYVQVRFIEAKLDAVLTLPSNTLLFRSEGPQVGVVAADGQVQLRSVTLGRDFGATVEILEGLSAKERVVLNPSDSLVSGTKVRIAEPHSSQSGNSAAPTSN